MPVILQLILVGMLIAGLVTGYFQYQSLKSKVIVSGQVVDLPSGRSSKGGTTYGMVATFRSSGQQEWTYTSGWKSSHPGYAIGDPIRIYYDPADPARNGIATFTMRFGFAAGLVLVPLFLVLWVQIWRVAGQVFLVQFPVGEPVMPRDVERR